MAAALAEGRGAAAADDQEDESLELAALGGTVAEAFAELEQQEQPAGEDETIEVWEENEMAVRLFLAVLTQWRRSTSSGTPTGLVYEGVEAVARMLRIEMTPKLFDGLQTMEFQYIKVCARLAAARAEAARS